MDPLELNEILKQKSIDLIRIKRPAKMKKSWNGPEISKISICLGIGLSDYKQAVNQQRIAENKDPNFTPQPRKWGTKIAEFIIEHNGQHYLSVAINKCFATWYEMNGEIIDIKDIKEHLQSSELKKSTTSRQGLDKPIQYRDIKINSIEELIVDGKRII